MKRGRRHGRSPHSRARAVAGGSNVGRWPMPRTPETCARQAGRQSGMEEGCEGAGRVAAGQA